MGAVCVDMRAMNPFVESVEDHCGVNEAGNQTAKQN
jgi:hypothetical protein